MRLKRLWGLGRSLLIYRARPLKLARMRRFYRAFVKPGDLCFDIGAHVGDRVAVFRALGARIVAVEPAGGPFRLLQALNGADPQIILVRAAVGAIKGQGTLYTNGANPTLTSLAPDWIARVSASARFHRQQWDSVETVQMVTLDSLIERHGLPAFTKIDVEGGEVAVLQGLSYPLPALSFEYLPETLDLAIACVRRVAALGPYRFNWCHGEHFRWQSDQWIDAAAMIDRLRTLKGADNGGDIYARLQID